MFSDILKGVGRFIKVTEAKVHDKNFLKSLDLVKNCMIVFDKAYNYYYQFALWTSNEVYFVTRQKSNAIYIVKQALRKHNRKKGVAKVLREEIIELEYVPEDETAIRTQIRCTLIAQLLMTVLQKKAETKKAFSTIATLVRIHLISLLDVYELLKSTSRVFDMRQKAPPNMGQLTLCWQF